MKLRERCHWWAIITLYSSPLWVWWRKHARMHERTHARTHAHTHANTHRPPTHTYAHACIHTCMHSLCTLKPHIQCRAYVHVFVLAYIISCFSFCPCHLNLFTPRNFGPALVDQTCCRLLHCNYYWRPSLVKFDRGKWIALPTKQTKTSSRLLSSSVCMVCHNDVVSMCEM